MNWSNVFGLGEKILLLEMTRVIQGCLFSKRIPPNRDGFAMVFRILSELSNLFFIYGCTCVSWKYSVLCCCFPNFTYYLNIPNLIHYWTNPLGIFCLLSNFVNLGSILEYSKIPLTYESVLDPDDEDYDSFDSICSGVDEDIDLYKFFIRRHNSVESFLPFSLWNLLLLHKYK